MRCLAFVVMLLSAGAAGAAWYAQYSGDDWQAACRALERERERGRRLDVQLQQRQAFAAYCERQVFEVLIGKKRLVEACRAIERHATVHAPEFLESLDALGQGHTRREKLAHNLASVFAVRTHDGGWERDPLLSLRMVLEISEATAGDAPGSTFLSVPLGPEVGQECPSHAESD